ncbi:transporter substrate-binding domain-containing protein [Halomonas sp. McH1-25]|uniref:transporter substrate-binding domain-containing protein n=1 Tax=unclassified Halomonas TaxID=2609666 RepID=UPI001EF6C9A9|nr:MULTISPECIES: transporter substrate-binding domain-containing protein [unclassified Halomonas]MCG7599573.1 transporter substrate-binding domain-containing protein [Halomonas sp. McH1-25]MCP1342154.1 transporter substrate-binding domain-containing protein [Halomonas sp. FL8]MCP1362365.1 transporter substrate-binding domain-containing protein [Halomonas sp. BBD45]MCP1366043.1 transporter substrate-binding domain-containing protein [Halomonas sp. BBD48]
MHKPQRILKTFKGALASGLLVLASISAIAASTSALASSLADIEQRGTLRVAVPQDFPPFGSVGTDLQPQGYDIDMAEYLAEQMDVNLDLVTVTSANRIPFLQTDKVDLVISSLGKNPERAAVIDFSEAYAPFFLGVFGTEQAEQIEEPAGLAGKTIGVTRGSVEDMELTGLAPGDTTIKRFEDNATTISAFLSGQVDYIATGNVVAAQIAERESQRAPKMVFQIKDSPCYIGLSQGNDELKAKVNALIEQAKQNGTLESLSQKWFHTSLPESFGS